MGGLDWVNDFGVNFDTLIREALKLLDILDFSHNNVCYHIQMQLGHD